ncbi:exopolysaccharide biosynthesis polyprenyl glycosylphosphotransferase [Ilumatobacter nonamiensis]|uniref:exopolysaccharide biosynthesis polyprenyl glycosylphosphotransferase n=1 Tax=Ilumatobacter nonamiensis TaxID=467093 RepID=UPI000345E0AA|nr:exopolysaccharide biosynthesis polyprenyl glycosylphosphotransferase [Ilumatobacter nonamiensis]
MALASRASSSKPFPVVFEWIARIFSAPLGWLWERGFRMLGLLDAVTLFVLMVAISFVRFGFSFDWDTYALSYYVIGFSIATAIHITVNYFTGLYEREPRLGRSSWWPKILVATGIGVAVQGLAFVVLDRYLMPRLNLFAFLALASFVLVFNRVLARRLTLRRQGLPRVVLAGNIEAIELAASHLVASSQRAIVADRIEESHRLVESVVAHDATDVLLLDVTAFGSVYPEPLNSLELAGVGFLQRVSARETLLGLRTVREIGGMPFVALRSHTVPGYKVRLKRLFDLFVVFATMPLWVPAMALIALYVRVCAGSPVLYRQERVGRDGELFDCIKFRTMTVDAEEDGRARLATLDDDRIVPALKWMRSMRADEIPQLWNVLKGEMSLVGPRPERPELVAEITKRVPGYIRRNELPPGLTGLAQIEGRYGTDAEFKLGYDIQYLVNWSLVTDIQILARTVWVVLSRRV